MKRFLKVILIGFSALLLGGLIWLISFAAFGCNVENLSSTVVENRSYVEETAGTIQNIRIDYDNADIRVIFDADTDKISIEYPECFDRAGKQRTEAILREEGGVLSITERKLSFLRYGFFDFTKKTVTLRIPATSNVALKLETDNGDIDASGADAVLSTLSIQTDNGDISAERLTLTVLDQVVCESDNGDIALGWINASGLSLSTDNGDIDFRGDVIADTVTVESDNGEVELDGKITATSVRIETDNGEISLSDGLIDAQRVELQSDNGSIEAKLAGHRSDYSVSAKVGLGDKNIENSTGGERVLVAECDIGEIEIAFEEQ